MPSRFTENNIRVNEKQLVFVITNGQNIISYYAYINTGVLTYWQE